MIPGIYALIPLSFVILAVSDQVNVLADRLDNSADRIGRQIELIERKTEEQSATVRSFTDSLSPDLLGLKECVKDIDEALRSIPPGDPVLIQHFGLDMVHAWVHFEDLLTRNRNLSNVDYRLLILTDDVQKLGDVNDEVKTWVRSVPVSLQTMKKDVAAIFKDPTQQFRKIKFEIRKYSSIPIVHGFRIVRPNSRCYLAICRWGGYEYQKYDWGEYRYQRLLGESLSPAVQDMLKIFDGYFNHHWQIGDREYVFPEPSP